MKRAWWNTTIGFCVCGAALLSTACGVDARRAADQTRRVLYYRDPMHPSYTSNRPGKAPDCGMDLEPVYADAVTSPVPTKSAEAVVVSTERQQLLGIRTAAAKRASAHYVLRTTGRVVADENRVYPLTMASDGWVTRVASGIAVGAHVKRGEYLVSISGRDYATAQRTFLYALRAAGLPQQSTPDAQDRSLGVEEARLSLRGMGFTDTQIDQLGQTRQVNLNVPLHAPASGVIVSRSVFPQQRFVQGSELLRIADLSRVWVLADIFSGDNRTIVPGTIAGISIPGRSSAHFPGAVTHDLSTFDTISRSQRVRLDVSNAELELRPDMSVDVAFRVDVPESLLVPEDAIVATGQRSIVFVQRSAGLFEPRAVRTGLRVDGSIQVLEGVSPDELVVVSGAFLLDSETRIRRASTGGE